MQGGFSTTPWFLSLVFNTSPVKIQTGYQKPHSTTALLLRSPNSHFATAVTATTCFSKPTLSWFCSFHVQMQCLTTVNFSRIIYQKQFFFIRNYLFTAHSNHIFWTVSSVWARRVAGTEQDMFNFLQWEAEVSFPLKPPATPAAGIEKLKNPTRS